MNIIIYIIHAIPDSEILIRNLKLPTKQERKSLLFLYIPGRNRKMTALVIFGYSSFAKLLFADAVEAKKSGYFDTQS